MHPIASGVGQLLKGLFAILLVVRHPRPIHVRGVGLVGELQWHRRRETSGIRWIDEPPEHAVPVVARTSRSIGVPAPLPDIIGLSLRVDGDDGPADLELASTGFGFPSRFWLAPQRSPSRARFGTLFPYRSERGPVLICARTVAPLDLPVGASELARRLEREPWRLRLYWARPTGRWRAFAELRLARSGGPRDVDLRFDAVRHPLPGAGWYGWMRAIREPAYRHVQR